MSPPATFPYILVFLLITCLIVFLSLVGSGSTKLSDPMVSKDSEKTSQVIQILVRQAARWALASRQDENAIVRMLHSNYAAGYLWALKDIAGEMEIEKAMGDNFSLSKLTSQVVETQDLATRTLTDKCELVKDSDKYLAKLAGH